MLPKLSVALIVKLLDVKTTTNVGVPEINPDEFIVNPFGNDPLIRAYVKLVAGRTGVAVNCTFKETFEGKEPNDPAGVVQTGCAILMCA
jgi:hypothetical protein